MISAFIKAVNQLDDPDIRRVLVRGSAIAVAVLVGLWVLIWWAVRQTTVFRWGPLDMVFDLLGGVAAAILVWVLFPGVVSAVIGLFLEDVAGAVERRHYPNLPGAPGQSMAASLATALVFTGALLLLNLLTLVFLVIPPVFTFVFYVVNGYLLGREYFEVVALRRIEAGEAARVRREHRVRLFTFGVATAFLLTIPVVNLVAPVLATAAMVHLLQAWRPG